MDDDLMSPFELMRQLQALPHPRCLVLGDLMLDRYTWGNATRVSQEAPVVVLCAEKRESRLGGAANVANMVRGLEASVEMIGVVGDDDSGRELRAAAEAAGMPTEHVLLDHSRPTTVKERFVGLAGARHPNQMLRVDRESREPLSPEMEQRLLQRIQSAVAKCDIVLISDYGKGVCTPRVLEAALAEARRARVPVVVDPIRGGDFNRYRGCTLIKPNRIEAELATGESIATPHEALLVGENLCRQLESEWALITLDRDGMALAAANGEGRLLPTQARAVYDITGAGDMVFAMLAVAMAGGLSTEAAARLANTAGGLEVEQSGVAIITRGEIAAQLLAENGGQPSKLFTSAEAASRAELLRRRGQKIVFTNGCFDLLHVGHVTYLQEAAAMGNALLVGVNSDESVRRLKGPARPIIGERDRAAMLAALECVSGVVVFGEDTPHNLLNAIRPDVLVKGGTYTPQQVVGHEMVTAYGGCVRVTSMLDGISTTRILESMLHGRTLAGALRQAG